MRRQSLLVTVAIGYILGRLGREIEAWARSLLEGEQHPIYETNKMVDAGVSMSNGSHVEVRRVR